MSKKNKDKLTLSCKKCNSVSTYVLRKKDFKKKLSPSIPIVGGLMTLNPSFVIEILGIMFSFTSLILTYSQLRSAKDKGEDLVVVCRTCHHWEDI